MAKNYATIYASGNDASALEQAFFLKLEASRGTLIAPAATDFLYTLGGGSISFSQPFETSPHRSGRHHTDTIKKKKELTWSFSTFFNINESLGAASSAEIDAAARLLWKSLLGYEDVSAGAVYDTRNAPDLTFTILENGDKWARQASGCFVQGGNINLPGNGEAMVEWSGAGKEAFHVGIAKTQVSNNGGNTITLLAADADRIPVGGLVMLIEADGVTRSADTAAGTARLVTAKAGAVITVSGAALADADGSAADIYVCYYEPATKTAINNPVTGLVGSFAITGLTSQCLRNGTISIANDHELVDYCFGHDTLDSPLFVPGNRVTIEASVEMNLNHEVLEFFNRVTEFEAQDLTFTLGSATGRRFVAELPKVIFPIPSFSTPETGSIPITFTGNAYQTALDAADELTVSFI